MRPWLHCISLMHIPYLASVDPCILRGKILRHFNRRKILPHKIYYPNLHWGILRHLGVRKIVPRTVRGVVDVKSSHVLPVGLGT